MKNQTITKHKIIWSISGHDCSGGAGIAADIKTAQCFSNADNFTELCPIITANTTQNAESLLAVNPVSVEVLAEQVECLFTDKKPNVIKIGLIANDQQLLWLTETLHSLKQRLPELKVVYDPVASASVGGRFSQLTPTLLKALLPLIDILCPNMPEAIAMVSAFYVDSQSDIAALAEQIQSLGVNTVIIKGGHIESNSECNGEANNQHENNCRDYCLHKISHLETGHPLTSLAQKHLTQVYQLSTPRINTSHSHGGGCSFATAISCFIAQGYLVRDAFTLTKAFISRGLAAEYNNTNYYGAFRQFPVSSELQGKQALSPFLPAVVNNVNLQDKNKDFASLELAEDEKLGLYPVVDSLAWLERLKPLGLNIIQLRVKGLSGDTLEATIKAAIELYRDSKTRLFINDHWQLAIKHRAYGIHLGQEDVADADLSAIANAGIRLGISSHGIYEFLASQQLKPSYLAFGAIFPTTTKDMTGQIQGLDNLKMMMNTQPTQPMVAIGGINHSNIDAVVTTGVDSIAVVTAITEAESPEQVVAELKRRL
ncbi:thiamine phosphate synthase [Endozoicomonas sp. G2_1]|uniref:thiamine phosphate synthase n=1 Tax=Endozoicomonas sp. G2_1 TaxID=2821091 RepID=UPI001ADD27A0|nr:thiamine phosphate synthase [Endozoicomonas sp. G2_1]MBO9490353.1 thiamine phosphate synthase [Endozoicomonas sp. G2_1]